MVLTYITYIT